MLSTLNGEFIRCVCFFVVKDGRGGGKLHGNSKTQTVARNKKLVIFALTVFSVVIIFTGSLFCIYSMVYGIRFTVLNNPVHGVVFGLLVIYLGFRYFFAVRKLKVEVYKPTSDFSFRNFIK